MKKPYLFLVFLTLCIQSLMAQDISISGTILSADDHSPLPGVTVQIKGTTLGTTTDIKGKYSIQAPANAVLVFSFVGMQTQEIPVNKRKTINVTLSDQDIALGSWWSLDTVPQARS